MLIQAVVLKVALKEITRHVAETLLPLPSFPNFHYVRQPPIQPYTSAIIHAFLPHFRRYLPIIFHFSLGGFDFISHPCQCPFIYARITLSQPTDSAKHPPNASIIALCILKFVVGTRTK